MTTVLVVDDQLVFRRAVRALVRSVAEFDIVGEVETGEEAVEAAARLHPDLVVMDVRLPGINGIEATRRILDDQPAARVLLISTHEAADLPEDLSRCGASRFVRKQDLDEASLVAAATVP